MSTSITVNQFSMERFQLVLKRTIVLNQRMWMTGFLSVAGFLLAIAILPIFSSERSGFIAVQELSLFFYVLGGLALTSMIFNEIHSPTKAFQFLTLPSTTFEKLAAAWFTGSVIYTIAVFAGIFVLSVLIETFKGINTGYWGSMNVFNPLAPEAIDTVLRYFFYQSIFLLGAVYFKKNNFLKTFLVIVVVALGFLFFINIAILIFGLTRGDQFFLNIQLGHQAWFGYARYIAGVFFTLLFIWLSYLQLKNKQIA